MNYNQDRYNELFKQLLEGKLSPADVDELIAWLGSDKLDAGASQLILQQLKQSVQGEKADPQVVARLESRLPGILAHKEKGILAYLSKNKWLRYAAAVVILLFGVGAYMLIRMSNQRTAPSLVKAPIKNDIAPGKQGAILTLDDGRTMVLDSLRNGFIADQNGAKILLKNGQLVYDARGDLKPGQIAFNTMTTPKGRQFQLVLPDGTKVWLNAASSLRYPTVFIGKERTVEITGEAYFEVAKDPAMPFHVKVKDKIEVEVLGTHFNINAYGNEENINTTLLEGSVRIDMAGQKAVLKPGQQAKVGNGQNKISIRNNVDLDKVMAWKNGVFDFEDATLEQVMRQLERWYDIDVVYEKGVPPVEFVGKLRRDLSLSEVLRGLELSKVHCRIEGRRLVVMP